jgi:hypothetical protein
VRRSAPASALQTGPTTPTMAWSDQVAANRDSWSRRCREHAASWYKLDEFAAGAVSLDDLQLSEVGDVTGRIALRLAATGPFGHLPKAYI